MVHFRSDLPEIGPARQFFAVDLPNIPVYAKDCKSRRAADVASRDTAREDLPANGLFEDADRLCYLRLLRRYCTEYQLKLGGYCLMGNHVHLLAIPEREDSLARALGRAHNDYSRWVNLKRGKNPGHVWQNRYYSCPLEEQHAWEALRYGELNPVRAGMVQSAAGWRWSSAPAHAAGKDVSELIRLDGLEQALDRGRMVRRAAVRSGRRGLAGSAPRVHAHGTSYGIAFVRGAGGAQRPEVARSAPAREATADGHRTVVAGIGDCVACPRIRRMGARNRRSPD